MALPRALQRPPAPPGPPHLTRVAELPVHGTLGEGHVCLLAPAVRPGEEDPRRPEQRPPPRRPGPARILGTRPSPRAGGGDQPAPAPPHPRRIRACSTQVLYRALAGEEKERAKGQPGLRVTHAHTCTRPRRRKVAAPPGPGLGQGPRGAGSCCCFRGWQPGPGWGPALPPDVSGRLWCLRARIRPHAGRAKALPEVGPWDHLRGVPELEGQVAIGQGGHQDDRHLQVVPGVQEGLVVRHDPHHVPGALELQGRQGQLEAAPPRLNPARAGTAARHAA